MSITEENYYDKALRICGRSGGVLINQSPHRIDLVSWVVGMQPKSVNGFCKYGKLFFTKNAVDSAEWSKTSPEGFKKPPRRQRSYASSSPHMKATGKR